MGVRKDISWVDRLGSGARSWAMCAPFPLLLPCPQKNENRNGNCEHARVKLISEEDESKWLIGGFPCISARGSIIISKVKI